MKDFMTKATLAALAVSGAFRLSLAVVNEVNRHPSSVEDTYEVTITNLSLDANSQLENLDSVFIRATFAQDRTLEFGRNEHWKLSRGESKPVNIKFDVERNWIQRDDSMQFRLEIVQDAGFPGPSVRVRCDQVSRELSQYNRSYQCSIPGEPTAVLSYRVAKKGAPPVSVAQNQ